MEDKIKVYQIGVGDFGRYGFEKIVEITNHLEEVDVSLKAVCDLDHENLDKAKKFAEQHNIDISTFQDVDKLYNYAKQNREPGEKILIYDAGPTETHSEHIYKSLTNDFFHLAEKPPSMRREEHKHEKRLSKDRDVFWKADFIERENPVVKKTLQILENETIDTIEVFRESSVGVQKILNPIDRSGVKGGDILDKMIHEIYVLDFLETAGYEPDMKLQKARFNYLMPFKQDSDTFMSIEGSKTDSIEKETASGQTYAEFNTGNAKVKLHSSWVGVSEESFRIAEKHSDIVENNLIHQDIKKESGKLFKDEEVRFFIIKGSKTLLGDMLNQKLYDLETGKPIDLPELMHDQLYRVIKKAILRASEKDINSSKLTEKEINTFMNGIFDIKDEMDKKSFDSFEELRKSCQKVQSMIFNKEKLEDDMEESIKT